MVHYYFGNKQKLLITVLERAIEPLATAIAGLKQQDDPSAETFAMLLLETLGKNPNMPLLFIRQILMSGGSMQAHFVEKIAPRLGGALPGVLQKGQDSGRISSDLDPAISALLILSLCIFPHISKPLSQPALGVEFDPEGLSALHRHVARFISRGLAPP